ncbi:MAG: hypothetical protein JRH20_28455, partial [Deltaproteobacteria bacterium]|nr:hypothetical protein [Deltaproteobacteria bacterium]
MRALEKEITRYFAGELSPEEAHLLRDRLRDNDAAREIYDRHAALLEAAAKRDVPRGETARVWEAVESQLEEQEVAQHTPARQQSVSSWRWLPALAGALLMAGMIFVVIRPVPQPDVGIKGGAADPALVADVDFDIFAIRKNAEGGFSAPRQVSAGGELSMED